MPVVVAAFMNALPSLDQSLLNLCYYVSLKQDLVHLLFHHFKNRVFPPKIKRNAKKRVYAEANRLTKITKSTLNGQLVQNIPHY